MSDGDDDVWRLPPTRHGRDIRLGPERDAAPRPGGGQARFQHRGNTAPEVVVKLTGRARGAAGHLLGQLDYLTRNGTLPAETQDGERITDRARLVALHEDWLLANAADDRSRGVANAAQSVALALSMPPGTPPDQVEAAARQWARGTFGGTHDWILARHDDTGHPHVHLAVRAVGRDGRRLAPGPADLQRWRERFARELRRLGLEAAATPRLARGPGRNAAPLIQPAERDAPAPPPPDAGGAMAPRRFMVALPGVLTRPAPAAAPRHRSAEPPTPGPPAPGQALGLHRASRSWMAAPPDPAPPRPKGRG